VARRPMWQGWPNPDSARIDQYTKEHNGSWDPVQETATFDEYVDRIAVPQVKELLTNYGGVSVLWWDYGTQMRSCEGAGKLQNLLGIQPNIITNDRLHPDFAGDTKTPEQGIPKWEQIKEDENWETCMTMNGSWGYKSYDNTWKPSEELIRNLIKIVARGGNYLLNVGPRADGTFPEESVTRLKEIGLWMNTNSEAVYGTQASPLGEIPWGECTCKEEKNSTALYLFVFDWPENGGLNLRGLNNDIVSAKLLATGEKLKTTATGEGIEIQVSGTAPHPAASVIKLVVKGKVERQWSSKDNKQMQSGALD
jgi:alpha-L-fucosidase